MSEQAPLTKKLQGSLPATAAGSNYDQTLGESPFAGEVASVSYTPEANITGDNTESRTLTVVNAGSDGNGTTVIATLAFVTGKNATDFNEEAFTLSVVDGAIDVAEGDILKAVSTHVGSTGLADPGGLVQVEIARS